MSIGLREAFVTSAGVAVVASSLSGHELLLDGPFVGPAVLLWLLLLWLVAGNTPEATAGGRLRLGIYVTPIVLLLLGLRLKFDSDGCLDGGPESDYRDCIESHDRVESAADAVLTASLAAAGCALLVALLWRGHKRT